MAERLPAEARNLVDELGPSSGGTAHSMFDRIARDIEACAVEIRRSHRRP